MTDGAKKYSVSKNWLRKVIEEKFFLEDQERYVVDRDFLEDVGRMLLELRGKNPTEKRVSNFVTSVCEKADIERIEEGGQ